MGQKIHPTGFRLAVTKNWSSRWYAASKDFPGMLQEDVKVREYLKRKLAHASVGRVTIERPAKQTFLSCASAASRTCCTRWMWEENEATMMRLLT